MITIPNRILNKIYLLKRYRIIRKIEINYLVQTNSNEWILFFIADLKNNRNIILYLQNTLVFQILWVSRV